MNRTLRTILVIAGVACFAASAAASFGWLPDANAQGLALGAFGFWLASTLP